MTSRARKADEAAARSGVRRTRPVVNNAGRNVRRGVRSNSRSSNNAESNAVRNNNRTAPSGSNIGNSSDNSRSSSRRNDSNVGNSNDRSDNDLTSNARSKFSSRKSGSNAGNNSGNGRSRSLRSANSVRNSNERSDRTHRIASSGNATATAICAGDRRISDASNNRWIAIETETATITGATIVTAITIGATTTATGDQSSNSAKRATGRNGSDARITPRSVSACSNSSDA